MKSWQLFGWCVEDYWVRFQGHDDFVLISSSHIRKYPNGDKIEAESGKVIASWEKAARLAEPDTLPKCEPIDDISELPCTDFHPDFRNLIPEEAAKELYVRKNCRAILHLRRMATLYPGERVGNIETVIASEHKRNPTPDTLLQMNRIQQWNERSPGPST
jgi:hypothetical protein